MSNNDPIKTFDHDRMVKAFQGMLDSFSEISEKAQRSISSLQTFEEAPKGPNPMSADKIKRAKARKAKRKNGGPR